MVKEFNAKLYFYNCVDPMHPLYHSAELSIVIQNFELQFGEKPFQSLIRLQYAIGEQMDRKEEKVFEEIS